MPDDKSYSHLTDHEFNEYLETLWQPLYEDFLARKEAFEERYAIERPDDGKSTVQRAIEQLTQPERFLGHHAVCRSILRDADTRSWGHK